MSVHIGIQGKNKTILTPVIQLRWKPRMFYNIPYLKFSGLSILWWKFHIHKAKVPKAEVRLQERHARPLPPPKKSRNQWTTPDFCSFYDQGRILKFLIFSLISALCLVCHLFPSADLLTRLLPAPRLTLHFTVIPLLSLQLPRSFSPRANRAQRRARGHGRLQRWVEVLKGSTFSISCFSPGASGSHPRHWHFYQRRLTVKLNACRPLVKTVPRQFKSNLPVQADTLSHFPNMNLRASASWGFLLFFFRLNMARADYSGPCGSVWDKRTKGRKHPESNEE